MLTKGYLEELIKDEVTSSRTTFEETQKIQAHFTQYRGLLNIWLNLAVESAQPPPDPLISSDVYGVINIEIQGQLDELTNEQETVEEEISGLLANCNKKVTSAQGGVVFNNSRSMSTSSSTPVPTSQPRKRSPIKDLKPEKLVEGVTMTEYTAWYKRILDYLDLPAVGTAIC